MRSIISILFYLLISNSSFAGPYDSLGEMAGHGIKTVDGRTFRIGAVIDSGQHGDVYEVEEYKDGRWVNNNQVVKILDFHGEKQHNSEILRNYHSAKIISNSFPEVFLNFEYLNIVNFSSEVDAMLLMDRIGSTVAVELTRATTLPHRIELATETLTLFLEATEIMIRLGYAHGDLSLNNVGRLPGNGLRIFDFDSMQKVGRKTSLDYANDSAPELNSSYRTSAVSDAYSMGVSLAQILGVYNDKISIEDIAERLHYLEASVLDPQQKKEVLAMSLLINASLEPKPNVRKEKLLEAIRTIIKQKLLSESHTTSLQKLEIALAENIKNSGWFRSIIGYCSSLFGR